jgi:hypothetical protein
MKTKFISLLFLLLVSCGEQSTDKFNETDGVKKPVAAFENQQITCEDESECPSYIARITIKTNGGIKVCTGFLKDSSTIQTDPACLPKGINEFITCENKIRVYFPKTRFYPAQSFKCKRINNSEPDPLKNSKNVYFKIPYTYRVAAQRSTLGVPDNEAFTIWSIEQQTSNKSVVKKKICTSQFRGILAPKYDTVDSAYVTFGECELGPGNVGAPVLNQRAEVVATINETKGGAFVEDLNSGFIPFTEQKPKGFAKASNFSCLRMQENGYNVPYRSCYKREYFRNFSKESLNYLVDKVLNTSEEIQAPLREWDEQHEPSIFKWRYKLLKLPTESEAGSRDFTKVILYPEMSCTKPMNGWIKHFRRTLGGLPKFKLIFYRLPIFLVRFYFDTKAL